ncbi:MAG: DsbA family protein [Gammaproteobacteria bacterium]|nr:DsbA family protein [Gammaproteobacteria bacterium]
MTDAVEPHVFSAPLSVCVDVRHPLAYLALQPVQDLARELGIDVDWLPFPAAGLKPPPAGDDRGSRHRRHRARYQAEEIQRYAGVQGLTIGQPFRNDDTTAAALAHLWLREHSPESVPDFLGELFRRFWDGSLDSADPRAVGALLEAHDTDVEKFQAFVRGPGPAALAALRERLVAAGIFAVPSLVAADEVFVGRAHLPLVRRLLTEPSPGL